MHIPKIRELVSLPVTLFKRMIYGSIDELIQDFKTSKTTLKPFGLTKQEANFFHRYNPAHVYCRLIDVGMDKGQARKLISAYEKNFYTGILKFIALRKKQQNLGIEDRTICLHQAFIRNRPVGEGYGDCSVCTSDATNNPKCRGYYPFVIFDQVKPA